jgi:hypothetical protein
MMFNVEAALRRHLTSTAEALVWLDKPAATLRDSITLESGITQFWNHPSGNPKPANKFTNI